MTVVGSGRAHLITGGFPTGTPSGHDHDYARLQLLARLEEQEIPASVSSDYEDVEKWLPHSQLLITYVAGPHPNPQQCGAIQSWLEAGGRWLGFHGTAGGRSERIAEPMHQRERRPILEVSDLDARAGRAGP